MKKLFIIVGIAATTCLFSCNNQEETTTTAKSDKAIADSLNDEVDDAHMVGMAKEPKLDEAEAEARRLLDSIGRLPAKAQQEAAPYRAELDSLIKDLEYAKYAMGKWMSEYNFDSAKNDLSQRIRYLTDEKIKVDKVKDAILGSLQKADSLIRKKF